MKRGRGELLMKKECKITYYCYLLVFHPYLRSITV